MLVFIIGLKITSEGEKDNLFNNLILIGGFIISFSLLSSAMKTIDLSVAYSVWTGIGTVGAATVGVILYKERMNLYRVSCVFGIIACVLAWRLLA
ncbi:SMR family transporter [Bacillus sp. PK3_68]|uniref:DMT family transporter n=1 Tax=Bacillus sp. PK3_68 TaxID=2027408 RepID=UPI001C7D062F|nr:SMR family transporter [Bacillus sp. PK3_68]